MQAFIKQTAAHKIQFIYILVTDPQKPCPKTIWRFCYPSCFLSTSGLLLLLADDCDHPSPASKRNNAFSP